MRLVCDSAQFVPSLSRGVPRSLQPSGNASSVSYVGFQRAGESMYGYTLDCETDCLLQTANGSDPTITDDASVPQVCPLVERSSAAYSSPSLHCSR